MRSSERAIRQLTEAPERTLRRGPLPAGRAAPVSVTMSVTMSVTIDHAAIARERLWGSEMARRCAHSAMRAGLKGRMPLVGIPVPSRTLAQRVRNVLRGFRCALGFLAEAILLRAQAWLHTQIATFSG